MFDIGFLELMAVLVIALLVIGPERMPEVARKIGTFMGKMRRFVNSVKEEGQVQDTLREIKDSMNIEEEKKQMGNISKELEQGLNFGDVNLDDFQRPTFGGETPPTDNAGSQFNKPPAQPNAPTSNTTQADTAVNTVEVSHDTKTPNVEAPVTETDSVEPAKTVPEKDNQKS
ncbi:MAG TPA: twin-arginine translocase subunit TatB [Thiomicrospira sp.]|jgi:sec-independent protein translocase protein TatB|nr:twin-arginine translocase subunit TatB [Thiomicrospira sp.]